jgi:hypothetical protein
MRPTLLLKTEQNAARRKRNWSWSGTGTHEAEVFLSLPMSLEKEKAKEFAVHSTYHLVLPTHACFALTSRADTGCKCCLGFSFDIQLGSVRPLWYRSLWSLSGAAMRPAHARGSRQPRLPCLLSAGLSTTVNKIQQPNISVTLVPSLIDLLFVHDCRT